ncbi:MAG: spiro-SPASM protein, partial [Treponema sp.]|nr:spiro-SPASM protein [Treponema sp.]
MRVKGFEDDIENFYRFWKEESGRKDCSHIIIQKYDDFSGVLPKLQATDLSPVKRRPCWHIQRDMNIFLDGRVPYCRENLDTLKGTGDIRGNALTEDLNRIWENGAALYREHC